MQHLHAETSGSLDTLLNALISSVKATDDISSLTSCHNVNAWVETLEAAIQALRASSFPPLLTNQEHLLSEAEKMLHLCIKLWVCWALHAHIRSETLIISSSLPQEACLNIRSASSKGGPHRDLEDRLTRLSR